jgi:uncharacterized membrane-anchored protein YhcB (DUF1043 family)
MIEDSHQEFKFSIDEESPDTLLREDLQDSRIDKLSRRITILAVLIPCIIGVVLFFLYLDLKKRVILNQDTGTQSVQNLSRDFDTRLYELSTKYSEMENNLATRAAAIEKRIESLKFRLYKSENRVKKVNAAKVDKKDQENVIKRVEKVSSQISGLDKTFAKMFSELTAIVDKTQQDLIKIEADISTLIVNKIDSKTFKQELSREQANQEERLTLLTGDLDKKLKAAERDIKNLQNDIKKMRKSASAPPPPKKPSGTSAPSSQTKSTPSNQTVQKKSGITVEDLN